MNQGLKTLFEEFLGKAETLLEAEVLERVHTRLLAVTSALGLPGGTPPPPKPGKRGPPGKHSREYMESFMARYDAAAYDRATRKKLLKEAGVTKSAPDYWRRILRGEPGHAGAKAKAPTEKKKHPTREAARGIGYSRKSLTKEQRTELARQAVEGGGLIKDFAIKHNVPYTALQWWIRTYLAKDGQPAPKKRGPGSRNTFSEAEQREFIDQALKLPPVERVLLLKRNKVSKTSFFRWKRIYAPA